MTKLLIVDDYAPSRSLLSNGFAARGYDTIEACDGVEALELARGDPPDLVISDALMPRMDGFSLCRAWMLDEQLARVPFFFYSASYPTDADQQFGLGIGASAYFTKPMPLDRLIEAVEAELAAARRNGSIHPVDAEVFETGHRQIVTRKLEAKVEELHALSTAYNGQREGYRRLFSANPQAMWIYDTETLRFVAVNDAAIALYGYSRAEWLRMTLRDVLSEEEHDRLRDRPAYDAVKSFSDGELWTHRKKGGERIQVELSSHPFDFEGRPARVVMALDVTARRAAEARERAHLQRIEEAMRGSVEVVSRIVELRDPYTAGHQRRTALLCAAIGRALGLDADRLDGLVVAGQLHDVGKIAVPNEILAKPGRLSPFEWEFIKSHPDAGYQLLLTVPFPWPIAEIVRQHHERVDGSGYPRGLSGADILLEARIIAVADTVEAMASHRPYRAAFPIERALAEIEAHAGTRFDATVATACLALFREQGYVLPAE